MKKSPEELKEQGRIRQSKWRAANLERVREQARNYVKRLKEEDPEAYRLKANDIAKRSREKHLEDRKRKERENSRKRRSENPEAYNLSQREYRLNNKEKFDQYEERYKEKNKIRARKRLLQKYNLTLESYNQLFLKQEGKCAICKVSFENEKPNIDHSHKSGKVRNLLCSPCNIVLGHLEKIKDRIPDIQEEFIKYLQIHSN